jgi:hypothetical protein
MRVEAVFLLQELVLPTLPQYQDPYRIPQILCTHHFQAQCHMVHHHLKFLVDIHTYMDMDRVTHLGIIQ